LSARKKRSSLNLLRQIVKVGENNTWRKGRERERERKGAGRVKAGGRGRGESNLSKYMWKRSTHGGCKVRDLLAKL
jgi:hypothetical protein